MLDAVIVSVLMLLLVGGVWSLLRTPRCRTCKILLQPSGEAARALGWYGIEAVEHYECPKCFRATQRRLILLHLH
jgi:hypothetical protein